MPGTRAVGPTTAAPSAPRVVAPAATNRAPQGVRGTRDGAAEARVRGVAAAAHLLAVPKAAPRRPLVGWRGGQRPRLKQRALGHSHGMGVVESGWRSRRSRWTKTRTGRWRLAWRLGRARTFVASKRWFVRYFRRAQPLPRRQFGEAGAGCTTTRIAAAVEGPLMDIYALRNQVSMRDWRREAPPGARSVAHGCARSR